MSYLWQKIDSAKDTDFDSLFAAPDRKADIKTAHANTLSLKKPSGTYMISKNELILHLSLTNFANNC